MSLATIDPYILAFSAVTVIVTIWMGFRSAKTSKTASDFFVAGRSVSVGWNASAISGEYLSAASFMGIAGMVMSSGYDALWYPVCYACGYLFLLLFIAGPLRRFGAYTIPDFAEGRYDSPLFRKIAVCFVLFIGFFYTMPQMKGAGVTLAYIFPGLPYQAGVLLVGAVITLNVALGGMKGITLVQAFQYWAKMFAISVPIFVLMAVYGHYGKQLGANGNIQHSTFNAEHRTAATNSSNNLGVERSMLNVERSPLSEKAPTDSAWVSPFDRTTTPSTNLIPVSTSMSVTAVNGWVTLEPPSRLSRFEERAESLFGRGQTYFMTSDAKMIGVLMDYTRLAGWTLLVHTNVGLTRMLGAYSLNRSNWNGTIAQIEAFLKKNGVALLDERGVMLAVTSEMAAVRPAETSATKSTVGMLRIVKELGPARMTIGPQTDGTIAGTVSAGAVSVPIPDRVAGKIWSNRLASLGEYSLPYGLRKPLPEKAPADATWLSPFGPLTTKAAKAAGITGEGSKPYSLLYTYSLIIALVCGTAGLPHILVRFYTNPDGVAAKRTTMWVMILIGIFYVFPPVFGVMGRNLFPELYSGIGAKGTDKIVLELPRLLNEKYAPLGSILSGITCAGAFAAFMSTFSGLLVSMTGALAHDVYGRMLRPKSTPEQRMRMFKFAAVLIGFVSILLGSLVEPLEINFMVGQAFAIAAASYFPLLFMSVWWRGMTMRGAAVGMLTGGLCALIAATLTNVSNLALDKGPMGKIFSGFAGMNDFWAHHPLLRILCEQPAIWTVPLAITLMIVVSKATRKDVPSDVRMKMLVLHAPEKLGLKQEYIQEHQPGGH